MVLVVLKAPKECILKSSTAMPLFQKHVPGQPKPKRQNKYSSSVCAEPQISQNWAATLLLLFRWNFLFLFWHNSGLQLCLDSGTKTIRLGLAELHGLVYSSSFGCQTHGCRWSDFTCWFCSPQTPQEMSTALLTHTWFCCHLKAGKVSGGVTEILVTSLAALLASDTTTFLSTSCCNRL